MIIIFCERKTLDDIDKRKYMGAIFLKNSIVCLISIVVIKLLWRFQILEEKQRITIRKNIILLKVFYIIWKNYKQVQQEMLLISSTSDRYVFWLIFYGYFKSYILYMYVFPLYYKGF